LIIELKRLLADLGSEAEVVDHLGSQTSISDVAVSLLSIGGVSSPKGSASTLGGVSLEDDDLSEMRSDPKLRTWREVISGATPERTLLDPEWVAGTWQAMIRPYVTEDGNDVEAYTISALSRALNRGSGTIRRLERLRYLPPAPLRSAPIIDAVTDTIVRTGQRRLYTYAHVAGLAKIWADAGLDRSFRPISQTVRVKAFRLYATLAAEARRTD
jgi:hypothetical protein